MDPPKTDPPIFKIFKFKFIFNIFTIIQHIHKSTMDPFYRKRLSAKHVIIVYPNDKSPNTEH